MAKSYSYNGNDVSETEVLEAAAGFNMGVDEYVSTFNVNVTETKDPEEGEDKKEKEQPAGKPQDTQKEDATAVSESSASTSEESSSEPGGEDDWYTKAKKKESEWSNDPTLASDEEFGKLQNNIAAYEKAKQEGKESITIDGEVISLIEIEPEEIALETSTPETNITTEEVLDDGTVIQKTEVGDDQLNISVKEEDASFEKPSVYKSDNEENLVEKLKNGERISPQLVDEFYKDTEEDSIPSLVRVGTKVPDAEKNPLGYEIYVAQTDPEIRRALAIEKNEGAEEVSMQRVASYAGMNRLEYIAMPDGKLGDRYLTTTWGPTGSNQGLDFTITSQGDFMTELGVKQVNYFTGPNADQRQQVYDKYLLKDKLSINEKSLLFLPPDLRENANELRIVYNKMDDLRDPISLYLNSGEGDIEDIVDQLEKLEREAEKIIKENKKITRSGSKLYDYTTGEFVKEEEANQGLAEQTNAGTEKYQYTSYQKLEDLRYQKAMELIYLAGKAYDDLESIFTGETTDGLGGTSFMSSGGANTQYLYNAVTGGQEALDMGAQAVSFLSGKDIRTYTFKQFYEEFKALQGEGVDLDRDQAGFLYDQFMLQQIAFKKSIFGGMTTIPETTLNASRYNSALMEFVYINRALELNVDEVDTPRDEYLSLVLDGYMKTVGSSKFYNAREMKQTAANIQQQVIGGTDEYWQGVYNDIQGLQDDGDKTWTRSFEDIAEGFVPFMAVMMEFYIAGGWMKAFKGSKMSQNAKNWWGNFKNSTNFGKWNGYKYYNNYLNPTNSKLGRVLNRYGSAIFEEYMVIQGVNLLNKVTGQEDIHGSFAVGAGIARTLMGDFSKWLASRSSETYNKIIDVYKNNKTIGDIMKGAVEPGVGVLTITIGETGVALFEGDWDKLEHIWNFDKAFELYMTLYFAKIARPDRLTEINKSMEAVYNNIGKKIGLIKSDIKKAGESFDLNPEDPTLSTDQVQQAYEAKVKKLQEEGAREKEFKQAELDKMHLDMHLNYKFLEAQFKQDNANAEKTLKDVDNLARDIVAGEEFTNYRNIEKLLKFTNNEKSFELLVQKIKEKKPQASKQDILDIKVKLRDLAGDANKINEELTLQNYSEKEKAKVFSLWLENQQLIAQQAELKKDEEFNNVIRNLDRENLNNRINENLEKLRKVKEQHEINKKLAIDIQLKNTEVFDKISKQDVKVLSDKEFQEKVNTQGSKGIVKGVVDVEGNLYVNRDVAEAFKAEGVVGHELFHKFEKSDNFKNLSDEQESKMVKDFLKDLTFEEKETIRNDVETSKDGDNPLTTEWVNYYIEAVIEGRIKPRSKKYKEAREVEFQDVDLTNSTDFKQWVDNFAKDVRDNNIKRYIKDSFKRAETEAASGELNVDIDNVFSEENLPVNKRIDKIFKDNEDIWLETMYKKNDETTENRRKYNEIFTDLYMLYDDLVNTWADKAEYATKGNFDRENFIAEVKSEDFIDAITSFDPRQNNSLNGWMNYVLNLRKNKLFTDNVKNFNEVSTDSEEAKELKSDEVVEEVVDKDTPSFRSQLDEVMFPTFSKGETFFSIDSDMLMETGDIPSKTINEITKWANRGSGPKFLFLGGPPASGKSTAVKILKENIDKLDNFEIINSDTYVEQAKKKAGLPEFEGNYNAEQRKARAKITADAQKYLKEKLEKAINQGKNIILDGTSTSSNAVKQKINQILESENYDTPDIAMLEVAGDLEGAVQRNEYREERSLPTGIVIRTALDYEKNKEQREELFKPYDFSKRVITSSAKYMSRNQDMELKIDSDKIRDPEYDKAIEELGNPYYSEILKDLEKGEDYEKNLLKLKPLIDKIDPYILRKYNIDVYYEPVMTEGGGSQKKVNNQLQWKEKKPTSKEYMDYWLGVGKTKNTKGNRKQMLAKIIGAQVGLDGIVKAVDIAIQNNGRVPVYNNKGEKTGEVDILSSKTAEEKIDILEDAMLANAANKFRRDQGQQFSEVSFNKIKKILKEAEGDLESKIRALEQVRQQFPDIINEATYEKFLNDYSALLGSFDYISKGSATDEELNNPITRENKNVLESIKKFNDKKIKVDGQVIQIKPTPIGGKQSPYYKMQIEGDISAANRVKRIKKNVALLYNELPTDLIELIEAELELSAGLNKQKQVAIDGKMRNPSKGYLKDLPGETYLDKLLETEVTGNPDIPFDYNPNIMSGSQASGKIKKLIENYNNKLVADGKYERGDVMTLEDAKELKRIIREKFESEVEVDGEIKKIDFDEIVEANKKVVETVLQATLKPMKKFIEEGDIDGLQNYIEDTTNWFRTQTNVGDGVLKGAFTVTSITREIPKLTGDTFGDYHAEHLMAMGVVTENWLKAVEKYLEDRNVNEFNEAMANIANQAVQGIITRQQQKKQDTDSETGKSTQTTGEIIEGKVEIDALDSEIQADYLENSISLLGDVNKPVSVIGGYKLNMLEATEANLIKELNEVENKLNKLNDIDSNLENKIKELRRDITEDGKLDNKKSFNDLKKTVNQYSEAAKEGDVEKFNDYMKEKFGDKWGPTGEAANKAAPTKKGVGPLRYSAMDFRTLLFQIMPDKGTGEQNQQAKDFILNKLEQPYWDGIDASISDGLYMADKVSSLLKSYENKPEGAKLNGKIEGTEFTVDDAVRVYLWNKSGYEVPGVSDAELRNMVELVEGNEALNTLANELDNAAGGKYSEPGDGWSNGTIGSDIGDLYAQKQREFYLEDWENNVNEILNPETMAKLQATMGKEYVDMLKDAIDRMKKGSNVRDTDKLSKFIQRAIINRTTGATMFLNTRSALMQMISSMNYINTSFNNPAKAALAVANQPQYWSDVAKLWTSDYLVARRGSQSIDISEGELTTAARNGGLGGMIDYLLSKGYTFTKLADSLAQAVGGATWYRNYVKDLMKKDPSLSKEAAEAMADIEFPKMSRRTQQSDDPALISYDQTSLLGRSLLQFATTQQQYVRRATQDLQDLLAGRGSWKEKVGGMLNYLVIQNAAYSVLFNGLWTMAADPTVTEEDKQKYYDSLNSILDGMLRGFGVLGSVIASGKNGAIEYSEQANADRPKYDKVKDVILATAPWIGQKNNLLNKAARNLGYADTKGYQKMDKSEQKFWENPYVNAVAATGEAITSIPFEELLRKFEAFEYMLNDANPSWKRIAVGLGYESYQLDSEATKAAKSDEVNHDKRMRKNNMMKGPTIGPTKRSPNNKMFDKIH